MVFVLDNYDSFTYNLVQYFGELGAKVEVRRNDQVTVRIGFHDVAAHAADRPRRPSARPRAGLERPRVGGRDRAGSGA